MRYRLWMWALVVVLLLGCGPDEDGGSGTATDTGQGETTAPDTSSADTGGGEDTSTPDVSDVGMDTGPTDTGPADTGPADTGPEDTGPTDAEVPDAPDMADVPYMGLGEPGFGVITTGDCGVIGDAELMSSTPALYENRIDFGLDPYDPDDFELLTPGGQEIILDGNAGGSSVNSEVFSYEVLYRCELAGLLKTETEIIYDTQGKITDLLVDVDGSKVGVSVTRGFGHPQAPPYSVQIARDLLEGKLDGINQSTMNVSAEDAWVKQILHVLVYTDTEAGFLRDAYAQIDATFKADTIVILTISDGDDEFIYFE